MTSQRSGRVQSEEGASVCAVSLQGAGGRVACVEEAACLAALC